MKKTFNLKYDSGKYYFEYSMPDSDEGKLVIDEKNMELDTESFYKIFFEKVDEKIEIVINNQIDDSVEDIVKDKGKRVCETVQNLCDDICDEINRKCFGK